MLPTNTSKTVAYAAVIATNSWNFGREKGLTTSGKKMIVRTMMAKRWLFEISNKRRRLTGSMKTRLPIMVAIVWTMKLIFVRE
jgi:hypothetical protein